MDHIECELFLGSSLKNSVVNGTLWSAAHL